MANRKLVGGLFLALGAYIALAMKAASNNTTVGAEFNNTINQVGQMMKRGYRNNNPGNIRREYDAMGNEITPAWLGKSSLQTDSSFVQFDTPEYGIRAIGKILNSYYSRGLRTIRQMISSWAPPSENNTEAYIQAVSTDTGIGPDVPLNPATDFPGVVTAIIRHENGFLAYDQATINASIALA